MLDAYGNVLCSRSLQQHTLPASSANTRVSNDGSPSEALHLATIRKGSSASPCGHDQETPDLHTISNE